MEEDDARRVSYYREYRRCTKPDCPVCSAGGKCLGPYWIAWWTEHGNRKKVMVDQDWPDGVAPALWIRTLGGFEMCYRLQSSWEPLSKTRRENLLLAALLLAPNQHMRREEAGELLWPGKDDKATRESLNNTVSCLRGCLKPFGHLYLVYNDTLLQLHHRNSDPGWFDVLQFERAAASALLPRPDKVAARQAAENALTHYGGMFLPGLEVLADELNKPGGLGEQIEIKRRELWVKYLTLRRCAAEGASPVIAEGHFKAIMREANRFDDETTIILMHEATIGLMQIHAKNRRLVELDYGQYLRACKELEELPSPTVQSIYMDLREAIYEPALTNHERGFGGHLAIASIRDILTSSETLVLYDTLTRLEQVRGPEHPEIASALTNLAGLLRDEGRYEDALPLYERALAIRERKLGLDHPESASSLSNLAIVYHAQGNYEKAYELHWRELGIREQKLGPDHPETAQSLHNLATVLVDRGNPTAALPLFKRALAIRKRKQGREHPETAQTLHRLASLLQAQGDYNAASKDFTEALRIRERVLGDEHPETAQTLHQMASLLQAQRKYGEALQLVERALKIRLKRLRPDHPEIWQSEQSRDLLLHAMRNDDASPPLVEQIIILDVRVLDPDAPDTVDMQNNPTYLVRDQDAKEG